MDPLAAELDLACWVLKGGHETPCYARLGTERGSLAIRFRSVSIQYWQPSLQWWRVVQPGGSSILESRLITAYRYRSYLYLRQHGCQDFFATLDLIRGFGCGSANWQHRVDVPLVAVILFSSGNALCRLEGHLCRSALSAACLPNRERQSRKTLIPLAPLPALPPLIYISVIYVRMVTRLIRSD
jgi:hypothetical protein